MKSDFQKGFLINSANRLTLKTSVALCGKYGGQFDTWKAAKPFCWLRDTITIFRYNKQGTGYKYSLHVNGLTIMNINEGPFVGNFKLADAVGMY